MFLYHWVCEVLFGRNQFLLSQNLCQKNLQKSSDNSWFLLRHYWSRLVSETSHFPAVHEISASSWILHCRWNNISPTAASCSTLKRISSIRKSLTKDATKTLDIFYVRSKGLQTALSWLSWCHSPSLSESSMLLPHYFHSIIPSVLHFFFDKAHWHLIASEPLTLWVAQLLHF